MRKVSFDFEKKLTDIWIDAYYTSFPCRHCSGYGDAKAKYEVFHLTPPDAPQCLSLKLSSYPWKSVKLVSCCSDCHSISMRVKQPQRKR